MGASSSKTGGAEAKQARADEQARQEKIRTGTGRINNIFDTQFTDGFFNDRRQKYLDYAKPQVDSQYKDTSRDLVYALDRGGLLDSSVRADKVAQLQKQYDLKSQEVADKALSSANTAKSQVEDARAGLITTLNSTGDAEGAANSAITRAQALSKPDAYSPLGQLFTDFTGALSTQAAIEKANALSGGATGGRYNTGLFGPSGSAVSVRR